jgi:hypothetical protein
MMIKRCLPLRAAVVSAVTGLLVSGCAATAASPPEVTVTRTVSAPDASPAASAGTGTSELPGSASQSSLTGQVQSPADQEPQASPVPDEPNEPAKPTKRTRTGPPTTIIVGRPTIPDPATEGGSASDPGQDSSGNGSTDQGGKTQNDGGNNGGTSPAGTGTSASGSDAAHTGTPPGSLSTDGDLIAAATSAAAAAGVAPADPDTPGPASGPPCTADAKYVNEKPTGLRSDVITAWHKAVSRAAADGITLCLNDGKRSRAQQQAQYDEYLDEYGKQVADQLVLQPNKSAHVVGIAIDVQPASAYRWLQATDGSLGFCRIYDNEAWHFEFNPDYRSTGCPARLPEPER